MHALALSFALLFSLSTLQLLIHAEINKPLSGFTIDLIHRHSPLSPFYDPSKTQSELLQNAALRSMSRFKRLHPHPQTDVVPSIDDPEHDYIMRIYVGTPPIETWAIVDTGSDLVWLQCLPCTRCYPQYPPLFDPKKSSTYKTLSCHSKACNFLLEDRDQPGCGIAQQCMYFYGYGDGSITRGELARDLINFGGQSGNLIHHEYVFGCGHNNTGLFGRTEAGIVGLGNGPLSLVSQLGLKIGYKFSYCLVPFFSNSIGKLKLGEEATKSRSNGVVSTPFTTMRGYSTYYILNIEGITVGEKTAKINQISKYGNTIIDSGSPYTSLPSSSYYSVEVLVKKAIGVKAVQNPPDGFTLCFKNESVAYSKINNLNFVVHFKGAKLSLRPQNIFVPQDHLLCFAMHPTHSFSIYGNVAQVNFEVEYDLKGKQVSFAPADCTKK